MLGAPFDTITLLHYSESMAKVWNTRVTRYGQPVLLDGKKAWVEAEEFDTSKWIRDWDGNYFCEIVIKHKWFTALQKKHIGGVSFGVSLSGSLKALCPS